MTDKEIIKGLECCNNNSVCVCLGCPLNYRRNNGCISFLTANALNLINRQKAEIEELTEKHHSECRQIAEYDNELKQYKREQGDLRHGGYVHNDSETYIMRSDYALHNIPVDPKTVGEYTGMTDKNGKKIFEGDIVRYSYDYPDSVFLKAEGKTNEDIIYRIGDVFWSEWRGTWAAATRVGKRAMNQDLYAYIRNPNRVEIIGNIHDNPELMKGE